jgi:hypothetical protein
MFICIVLGNRQAGISDLRYVGASTGNGGAGLSSIIGLP